LDKKFYNKVCFIFMILTMDCGNYGISWILSEINQYFEQSDFIFSEVFSWVSLLPKIWIVLLKYFTNIEIIHEHQDIFINIKDEELPILDEYKYRLNEFQKSWWKYSNREINIEYLKEKLKDNYCIIPIKKGEWSHFVILYSIDENEVNLVDNKKWEFSVTVEEFENLIDLENWKYDLFASK
jgi:hypothetical protein